MSATLLYCWDADGARYNISSNDFDCDKHFADCECPPLQANPDIAGIGVVVAFAISSSLTLVSTIMALLLFRRDQANSLNPIDNLLRRRLCRPIQEWLGQEVCDKWCHVLYSMVVCLSDQQLVTGIAVLAAAIKLLDDSTITVYHFTMAADLAWFSSNTHLLSLILIRSCTHGVTPTTPVGPEDSDTSRRQYGHMQNRKSMERYPLVFRVLLMIVLASMLFYVSWVEGYIDWYDNYNCPAKCTVPYKKGGDNLQWTIVDFVYIFFDYPPSIIALSLHVRVYWMGHLRTKVLGNPNTLKPSSRKRGPRTVRTMKTGFRACWHIISSETFEVSSQIAWHLLGYYSLASDRSCGQLLWMSRDQTDQENSLTFGQLVPILLLTLLILQLLESLADWAGAANDTDSVTGKHRHDSRRASWSSAGSLPLTRVRLLPGTW